MKYFILVYIFLLSGCSIVNKEVSSIPKWYIQAPQNNNTFIYGVSEGSSLKEAKAGALNDMAGRLVINVSSTLNKHTQTSQINLKQTSYTKDVSQDINLEVEKIKFTNAKVDKSKLINNQFFIVMKINRQDLFNQKLKAFNLINSSIDKQIVLNSSKTILEQINQLQKLYPKLVKAKKSAYILYAINNDFNYMLYVSKYDDLIDSIQKLKNKIIIDVREDKNHLFKEELINLLNKNSYKISSKKVDVNIVLKNIVVYSKYKGWNIVKITTTISILSNGKNITNKTLNIVGRSASNKQNALSNARYNFKNKINKMGVDSILFNLW